MRGLWKWGVGCVLGVLVVAGANLPAALACSGGVTMPLGELIENADIVVKGRLESVDDAHQNGILRVENYLVGAGAESIVLALNDPARVTGLIEGRTFGGGGCFYFANNLYEGHEIIIFLTRNINGSYRLAPRHFTNRDFYDFTEAETISIYLSETNRRDVNEAELEALITETSGQAPTPPDRDAPYPLPAPLLITAQSGAVFLVPVDGGSLVYLRGEDLRWLRRHNRAGCSSAGCAGFSPNGVDLAYITGDDTIELGYSAHRPLAGQAFLFSSTSEALAVWNRDRLEIYSLYYPRLGFENYELELLNTDEFMIYADEGQERRLAGKAAWSPDGRMLAYSDTEGIMLWDALTPNADPRPLQLSRYNPNIHARYFSPGGRYLAAADDDERYTLDVYGRTGQTLPDGLVSPDDRLLLAYDTAAEEPTELRVYSLLTNQATSQLTFLYARQAMWINKHHFLVVNCESAEVATCKIFDVPAVTPGRFTEIERGYAFDYEPVSEALVVVKDRETIAINGEERRVFGQGIEAEISSVEWLPSLFYEE